MKSLMKKVRGDKKGFTLAELLVVVAIIGILVAISIPVFTSQLAKARKATNQANLRAAKAAAVAQYLTDAATGEKFYSYDLEKGIATSIAELSLSADKKVTIEGATDTGRYTEIEVSVKASTVDDTKTDENTGTSVTKGDGDVVLYAALPSNSDN